MLPATDLRALPPTVHTMSQRSGSFIDFRGGNDDEWMSSDGSTDEEMVERALSPMSSHAESQVCSISPA